MTSVHQLYISCHIHQMCLFSLIFFSPPFFHFLFASIIIRKKIYRRNLVRGWEVVCVYFYSNCSVNPNDLKKKKKKTLKQRTPTSTQKKKKRSKKGEKEGKKKKQRLMVTGEKKKDKDKKKLRKCKNHPLPIQMQ